MKVGGAKDQSIDPYLFFLPPLDLFAGWTKVILPLGKGAVQARCRFAVPKHDAALRCHNLPEMPESATAIFMKPGQGLCGPSGFCIRYRCIRCFGGLQALELFQCFSVALRMDLCFFGAMPACCLVISSAGRRVEGHLAML